jgi:hypothetical protein
MSQHVYDIAVTQFTRTLKGLKKSLEEAQKFAKERNFDDNSFLSLKAAPDMFPLVRQVQIATDNAKGGVSRLSGKQAPVFEDNETTMQQLVDRIDKTISYMAEFKASDFDNYKNQEMRFPWLPGFHIKGQDFFETHLIPNFYFHVTTAYVLIRNAGVNLGKKEFLGNQNWRKD